MHIGVGKIPSNFQELIEDFANGVENKASADSPSFSICLDSTGDVRPRW